MAWASQCQCRCRFELHCFMYVFYMELIQSYSLETAYVLRPLIRKQ